MGYAELNEISTALRPLNLPASGKKRDQGQQPRAVGEGGRGLCPGQGGPPGEGLFKLRSEE